MCNRYKIFKKKHLKDTTIEKTRDSFSFSDGYVFTQFINIKKSTMCKLREKTTIQVIHSRLIYIYQFECTSGIFGPFSAMCARWMLLLIWKKYNTTLISGKVGNKCIKAMDIIIPAWVLTAAVFCTFFSVRHTLKLLKYKKQFKLSCTVIWSCDISL